VKPVRRIGDSVIRRYVCLADAVVREKPNAKTADKKLGGASFAPNDPKGKKPLYSASVSLEGNKMQIKNKMADPRAGMAVTIGTRYLTSE
jgi:hypothetical protein